MRSAGLLSSSGACWEAHMAQHSLVHSQLSWVTAHQKEAPGHPCTHLHMMTTAIKFKDSCSLEEKL